MRGNIFRNLLMIVRAQEDEGLCLTLDTDGDRKVPVARFDPIVRRRIPLSLVNEPAGQRADRSQEASRSQEAIRGAEGHLHKSCGGNTLMNATREIYELCPGVFTA